MKFTWLDWLIVAFIIFCLLSVLGAWFDAKENTKLKAKCEAAGGVWIKPYRSYGVCGAKDSFIDLEKDT